MGSSNIGLLRADLYIFHKEIKWGGGDIFHIRTLPKAPFRGLLPNMTKLSQQKFKHNGHQTHKD